MKIDDLELSNEQVKELIISKAPKFYKEFIQKGIKIYRGIDTKIEPIKMFRTQPSRVAQGRLVPPYMSSFFDTRMERAGLCTRYKNALYTISSDETEIMVSTVGKFWCIPLGDYQYCYQEGLSDFANMKNDNPLYKALNQAKNIILSYGFNSKDIELFLINSPSKDEIRSELEKDLADGDVIDEGALEDIVNIATYVHNAMSPESLNNIYTNDSVLALKDKPTEVLFNCESYMLIDDSRYDLTEIFSKYYK